MVNSLYKGEILTILWLVCINKKATKNKKGSFHELMRLCQLGSLSPFNLTRLHKVQVKEHIWVGIPLMWVHIEFILILICEGKIKINLKEMKLLISLITKPIQRVGQEKKKTETLVAMAPPIVRGTEYNNDFKNHVGFSFSTT